jgi:hypothetical protein
MGLPSGAGVAQLVEQRFRKPQVARSIRVAGSSVFKPFNREPRILSSDVSVPGCGIHPDFRISAFSSTRSAACRFDAGTQ